jgi:hypothetical protein
MDGRSAQGECTSRSSLPRLHADLIWATTQVKDPEICKWIMAEFSTTTDIDRAIYAIEMMATMKQSVFPLHLLTFMCTLIRLTFSNTNSYFSYKFSLLCGLPYVTLEGSQADWESIVAKLDTIEGFGEEPRTFAKMLRAVLKRFVQSFEVFSSPNPDFGNDEKENDVLDFWSKIASHHGGGSGPTYLSGWVTAFCPWNAEGKWIDGTCIPSRPPPTLPSGSRVGRSLSPHKLRAQGESLVLDGETMFPILDTSDIPAGFVEVDVKVDDNGYKMDTVMIAGHLGGKVLVGGDGRNGMTGEGHGERLGMAPGWFMFVKDPKKVKAVEEGKKQRIGELSSLRRVSGIGEA